MVQLQRLRPEEFNGSPNARAGRIDSYTLLHFVGGYDFNENFRLQAGVNNATDLEYIAELGTRPEQDREHL